MGSHKSFEDEFYHSGSLPLNAVRFEQTPDDLVSVISSTLASINEEDEDEGYGNNGNGCVYAGGAAGVINDNWSMPSDVSFISAGESGGGTSIRSGSTVTGSGVSERQRLVGSKHSSRNKRRKKQRKRSDRGGGSISSGSQRSMATMLRSRRTILARAELEAERDKRRGKVLFLACMFMAIVVVTLLFDQIPPVDEWKNIFDNNFNITVTINNHKISSGSKKQKQNLDNKYDANSKYPNADSHGHHQNDGSSSNNQSTEHKANQSQQQQEANKKITSKETATGTKSDNTKRTSPDLYSTDVEAFKKEQLLLDHMQKNLDKLYSYLKWNIPYNPTRDIAIFWHIPMSGTAILDEILSQCFNLVQATDNINKISNHDLDAETLKVTANDDGGKYVNVDMSSIEGIQRAKNLRLVPSGLTHVIQSSYMYQTATLFDATGKHAKCFTLLRNPIERAIDVFQKLKADAKGGSKKGSKKKKDDDTHDNEEDDLAIFADMTIEEYANSPYVEDNWMVRFLSNEMEEPLQQQHLELAQDVLGRKCLIGLADQFEESIRRFAKYFAWAENVTPAKISNCFQSLDITNAASSDLVSSLGVKSPLYKSMTSPLYGKGKEEVWDALKKKNELDMDLFEYAQGLFRKQALYGQ